MQELVGRSMSISYIQMATGPDSRSLNHCPSKKPFQEALAQHNRARGLHCPCIPALAPGQQRRGQEGIPQLKKK